MDRADPGRLFGHLASPLQHGLSPLPSLPGHRASAHKSVLHSPLCLHFPLPSLPQFPPRTQDGGWLAVTRVRESHELPSAPPGLSCAFGAGWDHCPSHPAYNVEVGQAGSPGASRWSPLSPSWGASRGCGFWRSERSHRCSSGAREAAGGPVHGGSCASVTDSCLRVQEWPVPLKH